MYNKCNKCNVQRKFIWNRSDNIAATYETQGILLLLIVQFTIYSLECMLYVLQNQDGIYHPFGESISCSRVRWLVMTDDAVDWWLTGLNDCDWKEEEVCCKEDHMPSGKPRRRLSSFTPMNQGLNKEWNCFCDNLQSSSNRIRGCCYLILRYCLY